MSGVMSWTAVCAACILILGGAMAEALGFGPNLHQWLRITPADRVVSHYPRTIFLKLGESSDGIDPLDAAMALRGLGMLHPRCIVIPGAIRSGDATRFLDGLVNRLRSRDTPPVSVVLQETPDVRTSIRRFPAPVSSSIPPGGIGSPFHPVGKTPIAQPPIRDFPAMLPLLGFDGPTSDPRVTPWWNSLPTAAAGSPARLFFGQLLLLPNNTPLFLHPDGSCEPKNPRSLAVVSLDDFLLRIEQMERGSISPDFMAAWNGATVVIGGDFWERPARQLSSLLRWAAFKRFPLTLQAILAVLFMLVFLSGYRRRIGTRLLISGLLALSVTVVWMAFLKQGTLFPILPGLIAAALLLMPWDGCGSGEAGSGAK